MVKNDRILYNKSRGYGWAITHNHFCWLHKMGLLETLYILHWRLPATDFECK